MDTNFHSHYWSLADSELDGKEFYSVTEGDGEKRVIAITGPKNTEFENGIEHMKYACLIQSFPLFANELCYLVEQFKALLHEHNKPFGWGTLTTEKAELLLKFVSLCFNKETPGQAIAFYKEILTRSTTDGFPSHIPPSDNCK